MSEVRKRDGGDNMYTTLGILSTTISITIAVATSIYAVLRVFLVKPLEINMANLTTSINNLTLEIKDINNNISNMNERITKVEEKAKYLEKNVYK